MSLLTRQCFSLNWIAVNGSLDLVRRLAVRAAKGEEMTKKEKFRKVDSIRMKGIKERQKAEYIEKQHKCLDEMKQLPDPGVLEIDPANIDVAYDEHEREKESMKRRFSREKMTRKHYKENLPPKELNFLTYGEKEEIRYLVGNDPLVHTPETLSKSFPISSEGIEKLLTSSFRAYCQEEVESHDEKVFERVEAIRSGKIPINAELKAKLEIRLRLPYKKSAMSREITVKEPPGEFQSIVIEAINKEKSNYNQSNQFNRDNKTGDDRRSNKYNRDGDNCHRHDDDDEGVSNALKQLGISPQAKMTLSEFEDVLRPNKNDRKANLVLDYLLTMKAKETKGELKDLDKTEDENLKEKEKNLDFKKVIKFKATEKKILQDTEIIKENFNPMAIEKRRAQDFEKEYSAKEKEESSQVQQMLKSQKVKTDLVRIGKSYYNDKGEFLYKVF